MKKQIKNDQSINQEIKRYIKILKDNKISVKKIILFGSFAKQKTHEFSDIDLAVISDQFGKDEIAEMMKLKKLSIRVSNRIEPIPLSEDYFSMKLHPLIGEIKKYGKVVYSQGQGEIDPIIVDLHLGEKIPLRNLTGDNGLVIVKKTEKIFGKVELVRTLANLLVICKG